MTSSHVSDAQDRVLPVEIKEKDGHFTRAYVVDLQDSKLQIDYDTWKHDRKSIKTDAAFSFGKATAERRVRLATSVEVGTSVEYLTRADWNQPERWYPATLRSKVIDDEYFVLDVKVSKSETRAVVIEKWDDEDPGNEEPTHAKFEVIEIEVPSKFHALVKKPNFKAVWQLETQTILKEVHEKKFSTLVVLLPKSHDLALKNLSSEKIQEVLTKVSGKLDERKDQVKRDADEGKDHENGKHQKKHTGKATKGEFRSDADKSSTSEGRLLSSTVLATPELLAKILGYLDLKEQHQLRGVSQLWKKSVETSPVSDTLQVTYTLALDEIALVNYCAKAFRIPRKSFIVHVPDYIEYPFSLTELLTVSKAKVKNVVLHGGCISYWELVKLCENKTFSRLTLRKMEVAKIGPWEGNGTDFHVYIPEVVLNVDIKGQNLQNLLFNTFDNFCDGVDSAIVDETVEDLKKSVERESMKTILESILEILEPSKKGKWDVKKEKDLKEILTTARPSTQKAFAVQHDAGILCKNMDCPECKSIR